MKWMSFLGVTLLLAVSACTTVESGVGTPTAAKTEVCQAATQQDIEALFDRWNASLQTGDPHAVVANYATGSLLLPTVSDKARFTPEEKEDYFKHFLEKSPSGVIDFRMIEIGCNSAVDTGHYTFTYAKTGESLHARYSFAYRWDGSQWLITSHHSSPLPEKK